MTSDTAVLRDGRKAWDLPRLVSREEAPDYLRKPWVQHGYLVGGSPTTAAYLTLFGKTNETMNAWTLLPGVFVALYALYEARSKFPSEMPAFWIFAASILPHAPFAIRLHCTIGVSQRTRDVWRGWDVFFIYTCGALRGLALAWFALPSRFGFGAFVFFALGIYLHCLRGMYGRGLADLTKPRFIRDTTLTVLCFLLPVLVATAKELYYEGHGEVTRLFVSLIVVDCIGASSYIFRWPERWFPGRFDLLGSGHQLMHIMLCLECYFQMQLMFVLASRKQLLAQ